MTSPSVHEMIDDLKTWFSSRGPTITENDVIEGNRRLDLIWDKIVSKKNSEQS